MAENKPRFRRGTVFAKNLGFGVGFGYRNNTSQYLYVGSPKVENSRNLVNDNMLPY